MIHFAVTTGVFIPPEINRIRRLGFVLKRLPDSQPERVSEGLRDEATLSLANAVGLGFFTSAKYGSYYEAAPKLSLRVKRKYTSRRSLTAIYDRQNELRIKLSRKSS